MKNFKRLAKQLFLRTPRRFQNAYFGAFPDVAPAGFTQMIEVERLRNLLRYLEVDCVFDIGANEGQYASQLRKMVNYTARIISFEPIPDLAEKLRHLSKDDTNWSIEEVAASDRNGSTMFNIMTSSQLSSIASPSNVDTELFKEINRPVETIEVRCERLESIFERLSGKYGFKRPFLKMDTQGHDLVIARGAKGILSRFVGIQSELAIKRLYDTSETIGDSIAFFQNAGFELSSLVPNNQGHFPLLIETDGLFIREDLTRAA